ncbi:C4-dicarboxylate transport protein [Bosea sp. 62]|uniref:dicarboxylate/amino acid:cation symporter n=1 Tax=unclassified Bosea (in: a-proteobacteria) TaxID=2653178 RepID=UPI0012517DFA|nr:MULTISPECIES: dicarboxylate/amino acid:cation symporter [unclassified Bosea (in: a-proteobacteria)]CAD5292877.1 C4-dicarboxylate transport protein [Bosea sp. 7B]CAD5298844.1 C4-dicarboxylate transport protein [Bosea sp. 21B]CAD5298984.1 C4-dicarboxylate transport protein [Bosea sp. 46]VVT61550.1 C4-dicarboxylate transport protein [Bosea sp. EC-HK365B]VXB10605.1 C4-dicarboxylate transport protein [Bosea sp. 127]
MAAAAETKKRPPITMYVLIGMILGVIVGYMCNTNYPDPKVAGQIADNINIITTVFLRLIKMIIGPLVLTTLIVGIAHMGDTSSIGRVGIKALGWFMVASLISLALGLILANLLQPGHNIGLPLPDVGAATNLKTSSFTLKDFITHLVPKSVAEALATNEILQIVVFSLFAGVALASMGETGKALTEMIDQMAHLMLKITGMVMYFAPIAVFAAVASTITTQGLGILVTFAKFMGSFYLGLFLLWGLMVLVGFLILGPSVARLVSLVKEPFLISFSTASSEAAYPKMLEALDRFGVSRKISSFMLPMGYSFNLDGSMMYCTFAVLFIAQAYGIELSWGTQISMMLLLMLTSKGMAGVPRASLVVIAATLNQYNIPEAGLLLIMGVDQFLDMGRSATNAVGNSIAVASVAKWEGQLGEPVDDPAVAGASAALAGQAA